MTNLLSPSLLACDPGQMAAHMEKAALGGAKLWHLDIMDGHFVPNLSFGPHICSGLKRHTDLPLDAHLMVQYPSNFVEPFLKAGAAYVNVHVETETVEILQNLLRSIRAAGVKPAVTIKPKTPVTDVLPYVKMVDMVLLMSVEPGYGGQGFIPESLVRARHLRDILDAENPACDLQIDGGITLANVKAVKEAGVNIFVAGSSVFGAADIETRCRDFCAVIEG